MIDEDALADAPDEAQAHNYGKTCLSPNLPGIEKLAMNDLVLSPDREFNKIIIIVITNAEIDANIENQ